MAVTQYNVVYRTGAAANAPVVSFYTCATTAEIVGGVAGDLAFEQTTGALKEYYNGIWNPVGGGVEYLGNYVGSKTYNDGDIVIGADGIAYMCTKNGTTTPPETWPGGGVLPHHTTHEPGGTDTLVGAAWVNLTNTFTKFQAIVDAIPEIRLTNRDQPADARVFRIFENVGILNFQSVNDAVSVQQGAVQINRQGVLSAAGLGNTPLDISQVTAGTLPPGHLPSNVAYRDADNFFSTAQTLLSWITINGNPSYFYLYNPAGGTNRKNWRHVNYGDGTFRIELTDDAINTVLADFEINNLGGIQKFGGQINFPAAQLASSNPNSLDDYEEGDWGATDLSGAGLGFAASAKYIKIGRHVTISFGMQFPGNANGASAKIGGLPFASQTAPPGGVLSGGYQTVPASYYVREGQSYFELYSLTTGAAITNAQLSGAYIYTTGTYLAQS
jgi:hypothetical protein